MGQFFGQLGKHDDKPIWGLETNFSPGGGVEFGVHPIVEVDVNLIVQLVSELPHGIESAPTLIVNKQNFPFSKVIYDKNEMTLTYQLTNGWLRGAGTGALGKNEMYLVNNRFPNNINVFSISLTFTDSIKVESKYFWKSIFTDELDPESPKTTFKKGLTKGVNNASTETTSFSSAIGVKVSAKKTVKLIDLSTELSTVFTTSKSNSHSISISEIDQVDVAKEYILPEKTKSYTYQLWQLYLVYETTDFHGKKVQIEEPILLNAYPLVKRHYTER